MTFDRTTQKDFERLVLHYREQRRHLPWRGDSDPYPVLVSEMMLQQTRVETVIPYYQRFLTRFPTLGALAAASLDQVLAAWSGLGYYRRARLLHRTARLLAERGGTFPCTEDELRRLPGVGEYTAAALASIAFDRPAVALDGNALRVFTRYFGIADDPRSARTRRALRGRVLPAIPPASAADFTQAVMELGALQCAVRQPACRSCPLSPGCRARAEGEPERYPAPSPRRPQVRLESAAARIEHQGCVCLVQSLGGTGLLEGMWLCPAVELLPGQDPRQELEKLSSLELLRELGEVRHSITFRRIRCRVFLARPRGPGLAGGRWFAPVELQSLPLPSFVRRILTL
ncbi:MAG: A/G-specific adenine glycosylase [Armatimonadetes bacterium]|nr:A/G-specific adenine glycosylase [Armatimonadota bacterium]